MSVPIADKATVARDFGVASSSYDEAARLQRHMGNRLLELLTEADAGKRVVDLGCGTGQFASALAERLPGCSLTAVDLSEAMIRHARLIRGLAVQWVVADAESLPFADGSADVIFSNLMIQWCADPRPVLRECSRILRPGGYLVCSTLLDGTLAELAEAWQVVDPGVAHVNRFEAYDVVEQRLRDVFPDGRLECESICLPYASPLALLGELKSLGAQYKGAGRRQTLTAPGRVRRLGDAYPRQGGQVVATYKAGYLVCRKPLL
ncbi:malonyl-ACP O-methyltransferase BioC [Marinobacter mobilis]|uniref:malonyl-ACP O-methyltransferase BioC n=1 Tax=Marinobacter mobilis TaxID=488533 RepID=UPI0035C72151